MKSGVITARGVAAGAEVRSRAAITLYLGVAAVYILTASGRVAGADSLAMFNVTRSLFHEASFSAGPCTPEPRSNHCVPGVDGKNYAGFGLLPSIIAVPAYAIGHAAAWAAGRDPQVVTGLAVSLFHALFSALCPAMLYLWLRATGVKPKAALAGALVLAFATPAWHYSTKAFYSEPYFLLGVLACAYFLSRDLTRWNLIAAGSAFGFACGCRVYGVILFPVFCLYMMSRCWPEERPAAKFVRSLVTLTIPLGVALSLIALSNQIRFGSPLKTGYHLVFPTAAELFANPFMAGLRDLLIDGEVGLLIFVPWVIVVPLLGLCFWRLRRYEAILSGGMVLVNLIFFAKYTFWHGGWSFGPRLLLPLLPFLILPLTAAWSDGFLSSCRRLSAVIAAFVSLSFLIQLATIPYPFSRYYTLSAFYQGEGRTAWWQGWLLAEAVTALPDLISPGGDAISSLPRESLQHLRSFRNSENLLTADLWMRKAASQGVDKIPLVAVLFLLAAAGALAIRQTFRDAAGRRRSRIILEDAAERKPSPAGSVPGAYNVHAGR